MHFTHATGHIMLHTHTHTRARAYRYKCAMHKHLLVFEWVVGLTVGTVLGVGVLFCGYV